VRYGVGIQNKVLEAMAMALPVVLTPGAANGIDALSGEHFAVQDDDRALADAAIALLNDRQRAGRMGYAARRFVIDNASWQSALAGLAEIAGWTTRSARNAA
jgi:glycosyltransferase involved in cell wall biosynthesis